MAPGNLQARCASLLDDWGYGGYSALILAARIIRPQLSISTLIRVLNSSGVLTTGSNPRVAMRSMVSGWVMIVRNELFSVATIALGVPAGTNTPIQSSLPI